MSQTPNSELPADMPVLTTRHSRGRYYVDEDLLEVGDLCRKAHALDARILKPVSIPGSVLTHAISAHDAAAVLHAAGHHVGHVPRSEAQAALAADTARLLPQHAGPFNHGWLARTHGLPNRPPEACPQPEGWSLGWQTAQETPSEHWPWAKRQLLGPEPTDG
jgi:hypothetical protein